jgi:broad specificity phosphatase PhoE
MRIYLVRHGESESQVDLSILLNKQDCDLEITAKGWNQAHAVAEWFELQMREFSQTPGFMASLIRSPWKRAVQTSAPIIERLGLRKSGGYLERVEDDELLRERELGLIGAYTETHLSVMFPSEYAAFQREIASLGRYRARPAGGESYLDVELRLKQLLPKIKSAARAGVTDLIVVGHSRAHSIFCKLFLGLAEHEYNGKEGWGNCMVRLLEFAPGRKAQDDGFNYPPMGLEEHMAAEYDRLSRYEFYSFGDEPVCFLVDNEGRCYGGLRPGKTKGHLKHAPNLMSVRDKGEHDFDPIDRQEFERLFQEYTPRPMVVISEAYLKQHGMHYEIGEE